jgi:hypothetical protein
MDGLDKKLGWEEMEMETKKGSLVKASFSISG